MEKKNEIINGKRNTDKYQTEQTASFLQMKEKLVEEARGFNLLSNVFMSVVLNDVPACQHVIRTLTGMPDLVVKEVKAQHRISQLTSHDAILDILAEDAKKRLINMEIQRKDTIDHARRTRFYAAMIDSECLKKGSEYHEMPDVYVIYISETDLWGAGKTTYDVEKRFRGTEISYDDGLHVVYVNAEVDDGSETAKLMRYFKTADPDDMSQGELSARVHFNVKEVRGACKKTVKEGGYRYGNDGRIKETSNRSEIF